MDWPFVHSLAMGADIPWDTLLWRLLDGDNVTRKTAEAEFAALTQMPCSDDVLLGLVRVLHSTSPDDVRALAAVLLRRVLVRDTVSLWPRATHKVREVLKYELVAVFEGGEQNRAIARKVCDLVGDLASRILADGQWEALVPKLLEWCHGPIISLRETALHVLERIALCLGQEMTATGTIIPSHAILPTLVHALDDRHGRVALHALRAWSTVVVTFESVHDVPARALVPRAVARILDVLRFFVATRNVEALLEAIEMLIEVAEPHALVFDAKLEEYVELMATIAEGPTATSSHDAPCLPDSCRQLAMEFLVSLAEQVPSKCRKLPKNTFVQRVYPIAFAMMRELPDLETWDAATCDDDASAGGHALDDDISNLDVGSEALERLVAALGPHRSLSTCFALIQAYAARTEDWVSRHAALVGLCQILAVLDTKHLDASVTHVLAQARDPHPRVCCAALDVLGQLAVDQAPHFQETYHLPVLSLLAHYLDEWTTPRLQAHAAAALRQFLDMCPPDVVTPYLDPMVRQLVAVLEHGPPIRGGGATGPPSPARMATRVFQEQAITALASVATLAGHAFIQYYATLMPPLQQILLQCLEESRYVATKAPAALKAPSSAQSLLTLGGITLECVSLIGQAVGERVFAPDAPAVLKIMAEMQATPSIGGNELIRTYLLQAWARCCTCLRRAFAPYLPLVMPILLEAATQQAEFEVDPSTLACDDDDEGGGSTDTEDIQLAQVNDKCLSIRTSILEEKATACQLLASMVTDLQDAFFPYAEQVTQVFVPLLTDSVHSDIRASAIRAMPALVQCVAISTGGKEANGAAIKQMVDFVLGRLVHALISEPEVDLVVSLLQSMTTCLSETHALHPTLELNEAQLRELVNGLLVVLGDSFQRRALRRGGNDTNEMENGEPDDDDDEEDEDEEDDVSQSSESHVTEQELLFVLAECIGTLAKTHQVRFFPVFMNHLWDKMAALAASGCLLVDRRFALFVVDDVLEHCGSPAMQHLDVFLPVLESAVRELTEPSLVQAAAFGIGLCASLGGAGFAPHAERCLHLLHNVVASPRASSPEQRNASDNAVAALGKFCEFQADAVDAAMLFPQWLQFLPLWGDLEESLAVLRRLCRYVSERHPLVLGAPDYRHVEKVVTVFAAVAEEKFMLKLSKAVGEQETMALRQEVASTLGHLRASIPESTMTQAWTSLTSSQQTALHALFT
ncbi:hypothetical protein PsorP6_017588 [Peronosclerospora sorghi]|uniref:Uncharacterized protein n=1 Tax=Peronosclerospora sorghi TaxID=230839 RepID=A0ACC0WL17_9STRA|nr:hypothetical protein PsorP6_017588 [Peronosclerospora sorghi]